MSETIESVTAVEPIGTPGWYRRTDGTWGEYVWIDGFPRCITVAERPETPEERLARYERESREEYAQRDAAPPPRTYQVTIREGRRAGETFLLDALSYEDAARRAGNEINGRQVVTRRVTGDLGKSGLFQAYLSERDGLNSHGPTFNVS